MTTRNKILKDSIMIKEQFGATTLGESQHRFKTNVNFIFGKQNIERQYVLRTKTQNRHNISVTEQVDYTSWSIRQLYLAHRLFLDSIIHQVPISGMFFGFLKKKDKNLLKIALEWI